MSFTKQDGVTAEQQITAIMNASSDAIIVATLDRVIVSWSPGAERIYGYRAEEVVGQTLESLVPEANQCESRAAIDKIARNESVATFETDRVTKDGRSIRVEMSLTPITDSSGAVNGVLAIVRDVSMRRQAADALQPRLRQQAAVATLGQHALAGADTAALMDEAVILLSDALEVEICKVLQLQPDGLSLLLCAGVGWHQGLVGSVLIGTDDSQAGFTLLSNAPVIVDDMDSETRFSGLSLLHQHGVVSGMSVIIQGRERPFGVLGAHTTRRRKFTDDDVNFLLAMANVLAAATQRSEAEADREARAEAEKAVLRMEAAVHHRAVVMETANHVALDILSSRTGAEALHHIADAARVLAGARYAALGVAQPDGQSLSEFITVGLTPQQEAAIGPRPKGAGVLGLLLSRSEPLRVDVLAEHPASVGFPPNHPPMESFLGIPIRRGDTTLGSLYLTNKQGGGPFGEADEVAVQALGAHAAVAIHNLHMLSRQRALVAGLMTAQEEERRAVAYDLHDGLTQYVMAAHAHFESFKRAHQGGKPERAEREMEQGLRHLKEAVLESRRMVNGLRLLALDDLGLTGALEQLLSEEKARCGWDDARFVQDIGERRFDKHLEIGVYRVAQEAMTNIRKHAQASRVRVVLKVEPDATDWAGAQECLVLQVRDWGRGFEPARVPVAAGHFGLQGMAERVHLLGGTYQLSSSPGQGTLVKATFRIALTSTSTD